MLFCFYENSGFWEFTQYSRALEEMFEGERRVSYPRKARETTPVQESATVSASTRTRAKRDDNLGVKAALTDRDPHDNVSCKSLF